MSKNTETKGKLLKISASAIKTYEQCPRKYFYNYVERAPRKQWDHFDLGNLCHKALEIFHLIYMEEGLKKKKSLNKLMSHSFSQARKSFPKMSNKLVAEAKDLLTDYLKSVQDNGMPVVKGVETAFNLKLGKDVLLRGFLDRLDVMKDARFEIVDYKTTKNEKYLDDFQLLVYGLWLKNEHPDIDSFRGSYILLRHGSKMKSFDFNMRDVDKLEKKLIDYSSKIKGEEEWAPVPSMLCNWCDFKEICPAQKSW
jgi:ATP-dependent helicase/DNAse subunit B